LLKIKLKIKKLPGLITCWTEQLVVAAICWRSEVCKQIYLLSYGLKKMRARH